VRSVTAGRATPGKTFLRFSNRIITSSDNWPPGVEAPR
jgi:hypothetical protein